MKEELKQFGIDIEDIKENSDLIGNIHEAIHQMSLATMKDRFEIILNNNLIEFKEKATNYRTIFGCRISYDNLPENVSFIVREDTKPSYEENEKRMFDCAKYLHSIESHDFTADIPISILNGDKKTIKEYLERQIKIYNENEYEYTDEIKCLKDIVESWEEI